MSGIELVIGGTPVRYFPRGAELRPADIPGFGTEYFHSSDELLARDHPRLRRIAVRIGVGGPWTMEALHWSDGTDLEELDARLAADASHADSGGIGDAVAGEFLFHYCSGCESRFRVLCLTTPSTYGLGISPDTVARHGYHMACPVCGAPTRRSVLEFLTKA